MWAAVGGAAVGVIGGAINQKNAQDNAPEMQMAPSAFSQLPPHLQSLNQEQYNLAMSQYGQPWGGFNPMQQQAMAMTQQQAGADPYQYAAGQTMLAGTQGGMNPYYGMENQYLQNQVNAVQSDMQENFNQTTVPMLDSMNTRANTGFGTSSAVDDMRTDAYSDFNQQMSNVANDMYYKDYYNQTQLGESNANRMLQAAGMAPMMQGLAYNDINALMGMGNTQQQAPMNYAQQQMNLMSAPFGSMTGGASMVPGSPGQNPNYLDLAMGGAMTGMGVYNMYGQPANNSANMNDLYQSVYGFNGEDMN